MRNLCGLVLTYVAVLGLAGLVVAPVSARDTKPKDAKAKDAKAKDSKAKSTNKTTKTTEKVETFTGMLTRVHGTHANGGILIKHANGTGKGFAVNSKTAIGGLGINAFHALKKGQVVNVSYVSKKEGKKTILQLKSMEIVQQAEKTVTHPVKAHFHGKVEKVVSDEFGDNGKIWVKDGKGVTKEFNVSNDTIIDYKKGDQTIAHTLQGVAKGQHVRVGHDGHHAVHVHVMKK
jgi:hypothetical protein